MKDVYSVLKRPLFTEKNDRLKEKFNKYAFEVDIKANKIEVRQAVEQIFGVTVVKVNTMRVHGKVKRRGRSVGRRPDWKKAIVTLKEGDTIPIWS
ncbi:50S ribosomal protein L23 [candidate division KSB3 bacterium]|jgi:large subunit ribosomal protein L23|uniref:Large ribosomal subunit protein uL23 n=1 Tax=candidate division KSB3 bacterium TaxID=2044937 RepID=A0A9D5JZT1_9BACT|nr:50S ribosomal protein L23 [candidate division KSB3 bacterium]MBD3326991.1 50S ribosomal protein L23 [candidate division KSB3 bacterium]